MAEFDVFARPEGRHTNDSQFHNLQPGRIRLFLLLIVAVALVGLTPDRLTQVRAVSAGPTPACAGAYCTITYTYTGDYYSFTAPFNGTYSLKAWGAQGGNDPAYPSTVFGGRGGYAAGDVYLTAGTTIYVYVGGQGTGSTLSTWNSTGGGGATDFRLTSGAWNLSAGLYSRILVAGGGGGRHGKNYEGVTGYLGNDGGGASSPSFTASGTSFTGSTDSNGGASSYSATYVAVGSFGYANTNNQTNTYSAGGWNGGARGSDGWANGGGGGGWYGGATAWPTGAGGSGYVLTSSSTKPGSYTPTSAYWMTNTSLIAGNASMPNPAGGNMTGRTGHGIATITYLNVPTPTITPSISSPSNATSFTYSVSYQESVTGLSVGDFVVGGTSTGWAITGLSGSGSGPYTVTMTGTSVTSGTLTLTQLANSVLGGSSGQNGPYSDTAATSLTIDVTAPSASFSSQPSSPAAAMSLTFGVAFSESVSGITAGDFSNAGTALGCVFTPSAASGTSVNVVVTQCQEGTLQLVLASGGVSDAATNAGPASQLVSNLITLQASALTVTAADKSINYGGTWTDSYTQSGLIGSDTVTVTYSYSGTTNLGTAYGPSATKPTAGGTYSIIPSVSYGGSNANRYSLTKNNGTLTIARVSQSPLTISTTSGTYGVGLTLNTSGGSGSGAVSYAVSSGSCFVLGSVLTLGDAGSACSVIATKAADDNYNVVSSSATAISTAKTTQATLTVTSTSATYGQPLTLTSSGGSGNGAVTFSVVSGTCTISTGVLTTGDVGSSCVVKATKATDTNYLELSSANTTISVAQGTQATLSVSSTSATYGQSLTLTSSGGSGTGAVTFSVVSGTCSIATGVLTPGLAGSSCVVKATKAQSTNYVSASSVDATVTISRANQAMLILTSTSGTYGAVLSLTTSGGSGTGSVSYSVSSGSCFVLGSLLTLGDAGSSCSVVATKDQDNNYNSVSSVATAVSTARATQSTLSVTSTSATYGQNLTLTSSGGSGTGAVTFSVVSGTCTITTGVLTPGDAGSSCVVKATKATDTNYNELSSGNTTVVIGQAMQAALSVTSTSATYGQSMSLTATGGSGSGAVSFAVVSGTCSIVGNSLTPGDAGSSCVVKATKAQSTNYLAVDSANAAVTIAQANQAILAITSTSGTYGTVLSLTTSGGSGTGSVSYVVSSGSCFVIGSLLTLGDAGSSCSVTATKASDTNYIAVSSAATAISTAKATQSIITVTSTSATYNQNLTLTSSGGSGSGAVTFSVVSGTCSITGNVLDPGNAGSSCVIKATKATDTNYNERSSSNTAITIAKASQSGLNITSSNSFTTGGTLALTATGGQSTGSLSWSLQSGACTLTGTNLTASRGGISCAVDVTRAGDGNYLSSTSSQTITVNKIAQLLTFRSAPSTSTLVGTTYTVVVDSDASLAPTITIANPSSSVCSITAGVVTFLTTGSCVISASQAGNDVYASAAASQSVTVVEVPVTTVAQPAGAGGAASNVSTTIPQSAVAKAVSTTSSTSTTTTTTTVAPSVDGPVLGSDGQPAELKAGEVTALVRGQEVKVITETIDGQMVMHVGEKVTLKLGSPGNDANTAHVNSDGVLVAYGDDFVDVNMHGLIPGTTYTIYMFSDPVELGRGTADENGAIIETVKVPKDAKAGSHTLQVNGVGEKGEVISISAGIKVLKKESNTVPAVIAISLAMLLALLGGRPIFRRRRNTSFPR